MIRERDDLEHRLRAHLHGFKLPDTDGRVHGFRQSGHERMKARLRGGHR